MPAEQFRELNRLRHHVLAWEGSPGAPTLVLLHGWLDLAWSFAPFAQALAGRLPVPVLAPDLRGHGETEWVGRGGYYHFPDYVADVQALLSDIPGPKWLLGHSMGGAVAALTAGAFPELVEKLVLVEGLGPPAGAASEPPDRMAQWITEVASRTVRPPAPMTLEEAKARLQRSNPRLPDAHATLLAEKGTRAAEGGRVWAFDPLHRTRSPAPFVAETFRGFLRRIKCPTLLVEGSESGFGRFYSDGRLDDLQDVRNVVVQDAGHMVHQDQPEALARAVAAFLAG